MIGNNKIVLGVAEMCKAVETYLNEHVLQPDHGVMVTGVNINSQSYTEYEVLFCEVPKPTEAAAKT